MRHCHVRQCSLLCDTRGYWPPASDQGVLTPHSTPGALAMPVALFIRHKTLPGMRESVRHVWERHMAPAIAANPDHLAYFYCFDTVASDAICAFQLYRSQESAQAFLSTPNYEAYLREVEPLLSGPPEVTSLTPIWS